MSSPVNDLECRRLAAVPRVALSIDGLHSTTSFDQPCVPLLGECPYTFRAVPTSFGITVPYTLSTDETSTDKVDLSNLSGVENLPLSNSSDDVEAVFRTAFMKAGQDTSVSTEQEVPDETKRLANAYSLLAVALAHSALPDIDESASPLCRIGFVVLNQLRHAHSKGIRASYVAMDGEPAIGRAARLWLHECHAEAYACTLRGAHADLVKSVDLACIKDASAKHFETVNAFLCRQTHADGITVDDGFQSISACRMSAELFHADFVSYLRSHKVDDINLEQLVLAMLCYDLHRIRTVFSRRQHTSPLGPLREFMGSLMERWQAVVRVEGPLGSYVRETLPLSIILCHFHIRQDWNRQLKDRFAALKMYIKSFGVAEKAVASSKGGESQRISKRMAATGASAGASSSTAAPQTCDGELSAASSADAGERSAASGASAGASSSTAAPQTCDGERSAASSADAGERSAASGASAGASSSTAAPQTCDGERSAASSADAGERSATSGASAGASSSTAAPQTCDGERSAALSADAGERSATSGASAGASSSTAGGGLGSGITRSNSTEDVWQGFDYDGVIRELASAHASIEDIAAVIYSLVNLQAMDAMHAPTREDLNTRTANLRTCLQTAWPDASAYLLDNFFSEEQRSLVCSLWRYAFLSSNATAAAEAVNRLIKHLLFHGKRSRDPSALSMRLVGDPKNPTVTERSLTNLLYTRNVLHRQQRGSTDAAKRNLRVLERAAMMYATAVCGIDGTAFVAKEDSLPHEQILCIRYTGTRCLYTHYKAKEQKTPSDSSRIATETAALVDDVIPLSIDETVDCKSPTAHKLILHRRRIFDESVCRRAMRIDFEVDLSRRACSCERQSTRCPCLLAGQLWARKKLKWPICVHDDDFSMSLVEAIAEHLIRAHYVRVSKPVAAFGMLNAIAMRRRLASTLSSRGTEQTGSNPGGQLSSREAQVEQWLHRTRNAVQTGWRPTAPALKNIDTALQLLSSVLPNVAEPPLAANAGVIPLPQLSLPSLKLSARWSATSPTVYPKRVVGNTTSAGVLSPRHLENTVLVSRGMRRRTGGHVVHKPTSSFQPKVLVKHSFELREASNIGCPCAVIAFDLETTGFRPCSIVQFAAVECKPGGRAFNERIKPDVPISVAASALHGILDRDVTAMPSFLTVWRNFLSWLPSSPAEGGKIVLLGFNAFSFDVHVLLDELVRVGQSPPGNVVYADFLHHVRTSTWDSLFRTIPRPSRFNLAEMYRAVFGEVPARLHSAIDDASSLKELFLRAAELGRSVEESREAPCGLQMCLKEAGCVPLAAATHRCVNLSE